MNRSAIIFLGVPMLMYALQGCTVYLAQKRYGMAITMFAYAVANIGLLMDAHGI